MSQAEQTRSQKYDTGGKRGFLEAGVRNEQDSRNKDSSAKEMQQ